MSLVEASRDHLQILEYSPLSAGGFEHMNSEVDNLGRHWCSRITSCPRLTDLTLSLPTICIDLFNDHSVNWSSDVHLRANGICGQSHLRLSDSITAFTALLEACRALTLVRRKKCTDLNIEMFIGAF
jgi:hypothetical protein